MSRYRWTFVVWCLAGTALYLWGAHKYTDWMQSFGDWRTHAIFLGSFGALLLIAWIMDRNGWDPQRPRERPPERDE